VNADLHASHRSLRPIYPIRDRPVEFRLKFPRRTFERAGSVFRRKVRSLSGLSRVARTNTLPSPRNRAAGFGSVSNARSKEGKKKTRESRFQWGYAGRYAGGGGLISPVEEHETKAQESARIQVTERTVDGGYLSCQCGRRKWMLDWGIEFQGMP